MKTKELILILFWRKSTGKFAFIVESSIADFVIRKKPCDLAKIGNNFGGSKGYAVATPIGSELRLFFHFIVFISN